MKKYLILFGIIFAMLLLNQNIKVGYVEASQNQFNPNYKNANLKNGAQLYDNWMKLTKAEPEGNHPLYPANSKKSGKTTWRCKECHGWDYIGNEGRYNKGSHYTGISGVFKMQTKAPEEIYDSLVNKNLKHDFSEYLATAEIWDLVKFIREGQAPIETVIDSEGQGKGDITAGKVLYDSYCASCHGMDGKTIDFKNNKDGTQGVGWLANDNPQESIHKIRWGHPGSDMPAMAADEELTEQNIIDILTYTQTLNDH